MAKYELDIIGNAMDSLHESLDKYAQGQDGDIRAHKFAILNFCHFMELILKHYISTVNENLIYSNVFKVVSKRAKADGISLIDAYEVLEEEEFDFSSPIKGYSNPHTIPVESALAYVESDKAYFNSDLAAEIRAMKNLRNDIEHHKFSMDTKEVRLALGRLTRGFDEFTDVFGILGLAEVIDEKQLGVFKTLADEYEHELQEAKVEVRESHESAFRGVRPKHMYDVHWESYDCPECGNDNLMIPNDDSSTGYRCTLCGNEESEDIEVECEICGSSWPNGEMSSWVDTYVYTCPDCNDFESKW
ncbi:hypothetical protein KW542_09105 [Vibrio fluvialis]|uniref:hypothetical protein n=1 Tax=Vibrio sp. bablab_jr001 TaxID=2755067 RepID=UPI0018F1CCD7|nr:hypothetical protein [Vibrio sp. bablab_jr001]EKO3398654.1 hypothetical protein [Vibrio fluvialis]EKO3471903.1 hypothetical protein [Vibrio fluvialis]MBY8115418.1 hypothetical protein [Vibrio fluvialis]MBY8248510.1 hypothetical protein [Vibrio fluvialis]MBY8282179.1 hypothetical protein [Vibrio fluvialis]